MKLDLTVHKGEKDRPVVIFIHGLAVDKDIWLNPLETKVLARSIPLKYLSATPPRSSSGKRVGVITVGQMPQQVDSLWSVLEGKGYNLLCWSQRRPVGPIAVAVEELGAVMDEVRTMFPGAPVALIGHSRGGLVARKFMETPCPGVKALITLSSPHHGSSLSLAGKYLLPLHKPVKHLLPEETHGTISRILRRINDLIEGDALRELMPDSVFFSQLKDIPAEGVQYLSFGGRKTSLITLYRWEKRDVKLHPRRLLTIPDSLMKFIPASRIPDEMQPGKGDIMVTAKSSVLPWASRHINVSANHFTILWNRTVIRETRKVLEKLQ